MFVKVQKIHIRKSQNYLGNFMGNHCKPALRRLDPIKTTKFTKIASENIESEIKFFCKLTVRKCLC